MPNVSASKRESGIRVFTVAVLRGSHRLRLAEAEFRDRDGAVLATLDTPDLTFKAAGVQPIPYRQGVVVFGRNWTFTSWSDEP